MGRRDEPRGDRRVARLIADGRPSSSGPTARDEMPLDADHREWRARLLSQRRAEEARLAPLTYDETALVTSLILATGLPAPREVVSAVYERTDGIPLHIEELLGALGDDARTDGKAIRNAHVPSTIEDAVLARFAGCPTTRGGRAGRRRGRPVLRARVLAGIMDRNVGELDERARGARRQLLPVHVQLGRQGLLRLPSPAPAGRAVRVRAGAYLGDTPPEHAFEVRQSSYLTNWKRDRQGWIVPFLKSPRDGESALCWRDTDRAAGRSALYRFGAAPSEDPEVEDGVIELTREGLQRRPPDILFLSLEMLNREIGNPVWARTLGIDNRGNPPRLLLLDEVHTYEGLAGAQVPWILQRWLAAVQPAGLHIVGLSATLRDAAQHLATIAGITTGRIQEVAPVEDPDPRRSEYLSEGIEYNVAVRGSTGSGVFAAGDVNPDHDVVKSSTDAGSPTRSACGGHD